MTNFVKLLTATALVALVGACAQQEEPAPMPMEQPIYSKDGRVIGMRPMVTASGDDCDPNQITGQAAGLDAEDECFDDRTQGTLSPNSGGGFTVDTDGDGIPDSDG